MKKNKKRNDKAAAKAEAASFAFQVNWEARKCFIEITPEIETRLMFEIAAFLDMEVNDELLRIHEILVYLRDNLHCDIKSADSPLKASLIAFILGIVPENPLDEGVSFEGIKINFPHILTLKLPDEVRSSLTEHVKEKGYRTTMFNGQPMVVFPHFKLEFRRLLNQNQ